MGTSHPQLPQALLLLFVLEHRKQVELRQDVKTAKVAFCPQAPFWKCKFQHCRDIYVCVYGGFFCWNSQIAFRERARWHRRRKNLGMPQVWCHFFPPMLFLSFHENLPFHVLLFREKNRKLKVRSDVLWTEIKNVCLCEHFDTSFNAICAEIRKQWVFEVDLLFCRNFASWRRESSQLRLDFEFFSLFFFPAVHGRCLTGQWQHSEVKRFFFTWKQFTLEWNKIDQLCKDLVWRFIEVNNSKDDAQRDPDDTQAGFILSVPCQARVFQRVLKSNVVTRLFAQEVPNPHTGQNKEWACARSTSTRFLYFEMTVRFFLGVELTKLNQIFCTCPLLNDKCKWWVSLFLRKFNKGRIQSETDCFEWRVGGQSWSKIAPWSSRWFDEILISLTLISLTLISLTLISLTLISLTLILLTLILVTFLSKILTFITQHSKLGNSFGTLANGTNSTKWNFYTLFHNNIHTTPK